MAQKKTQLTIDEKLAVLKRMDAGENVSNLAREIGVHRQRLYGWRDRIRLMGDLTPARLGRPTKSLAAATKSERTVQKSSAVKRLGTEALSKARRRIVDLERKVGQQQLDIDFFQQALRHIRDGRQQNTTLGEPASTKSLSR